MKITKGEFCRFSLQGKLRLLNDYGEMIFSVILKHHKIQFFKFFDFYVEVLKDLLKNSFLQASPVPKDKIALYKYYFYPF